jgi:uncharacterized protein (DUF952 family)
MPTIYHVTTANDWSEAKTKNFYEHQVAGVLERYFAGKTDLLKLVIDTDKLTSKFVFDWSPSTADTFPHVYGTINIDAVVDVVAL